MFTVVTLPKIPMSEWKTPSRDHIFTSDLENETRVFDEWFAGIAPPGESNGPLSRFVDNSRAGSYHRSLVTKFGSLMAWSRTAFFAVLTLKGEKKTFLASVQETTPVKPGSLFIESAMMIADDFSAIAEGTKVPMSDFLVSLDIGFPEDMKSDSKEALEFVDALAKRVNWHVKKDVAEKPPGSDGDQFTLYTSPGVSFSFGCSCDVHPSQ